MKQDNEKLTLQPEDYALYGASAEELKKRMELMKASSDPMVVKTGELVDAHPVKITREVTAIANEHGGEIATAALANFVGSLITSWSMSISLATDYSHEQATEGFLAMVGETIVLPDVQQPIKTH